MEAETETEEALKPETSSEQKPVEPVAKPQLVVLTTDDDMGVCNLDGECS